MDEEKRLQSILYDDVMQFGWAEMTAELARIAFPPTPDQARATVSEAFQLLKQGEHGRAQQLLEQTAATDYPPPQTIDGRIEEFCRKHGFSWKRVEHGSVAICRGDVPIHTGMRSGYKGVLADE